MKVSLFFFAGIAAALCSCSTAPTPPPGYVLIPQLPAWKAPEQSAPVPWLQVAVEVQRLAPLAQLLTSDAEFTRLDDAFAREIVQWTLAVYQGRRDRGKTSFVAESWDCDKFCKALTVAIERAAADAGVKAQPLAARVFVHQNTPWAGVPAGGGHAVAALVTDRGVLIVEPQNGQSVALEAYPNAGSIFRVTFGG